MILIGAKLMADLLYLTMLKTKKHFTIYVQLFPLRIFLVCLKNLL